MANFWKSLAKAAGPATQNYLAAAKDKQQMGMQQQRIDADLVNQLAERAARQQALDLQKVAGERETEKFNWEKENRPIEQAYKKAQTANLQATTKKTMGELPADPLQVQKLQSEIDLNRSRAKNLGATDPAQARIMNARAAMLENQLSSLGSGKEYKKEQYDAAGFARRLQQAEDVFSELEKGGFNRATPGFGIEARLPGILQSGNLKAQQQAERNFVNSVLRRESGAAISPEEFSSAEQQYFPRDGDTPEVLAQKKANRDQAFAAMKAAAGGALGQVPYVNPSAARAEAAQKKKAPGKPKSVIQGGHTYILNEETGEYE